MSYLDREPDLDLPTFRIWEAKPGEKQPKVDEGLIVTIDSSAGESWYETRGYGGLMGYTLFVLAKTRSDGKVWMMMKVKRSDRTTVIVGRKDEWLTPDEYRQMVTQTEEQFAILFDTQHPQITKGRAMNIYMKGGIENGRKNTTKRG